MDGILSVYKEGGCTSFDVIRRLRGILSERRIGHAGTLDPMAEGVLLVCMGRATKLLSEIGGTEKVYETELLLGITTDTEDITGKLLSEHEVRTTEEELKELLSTMLGEQEQIPPMYSAKRVGGRRLYELAREGKVVERKPCAVVIHEIEILKLELPKLRLRVRCGKGTYIRTLCADIGRKLGCGAVMTALKRTRVGDFSLDESHTLSEIESRKSEGRLSEILLPPVYSSVETVLSFGKFDGGHLGHQLIFDKILEISREKKLRSVLLTFSRSPEGKLLGEKRDRISTEEEHLSRLRSRGFDRVFELPLTEAFLDMSPEDFIEGVLHRQMHVKELVVGEDASFGKGARGDVALLRRYAEAFGYTVHALKKRETADEGGELQVISSSLIRKELSLGRVSRVRELLGRYFSLSGTVVHGKRIGGTLLHFPTANLKPSPGKLIPAFGVYIVRVLSDQSFYAGICNVGNNPTVSMENPVSIESFLLHFQGDLYGKKIRIDFIERLRPELRFSSLSELSEQLERDKEEAERFREKHPEIFSV